MLKIGQFSKLTTTTVKTLRYYEKEGLLIPSFTDPVSGYRYYETKQLTEFNKILSLRQLGLSIDDIKKILNGANLNNYLDRREELIKKDIYLAKSQLTKIKLLRENRNMKYEVAIKEIPEQIVYYKEGLLNNYQEVGEFVLLAGTQARQANPTLKCLEPDYCFMEYLDGEYKETNIKARYSQAVAQMGQETKEIKFKILPTVNVVSVYHKGAYENFRETYTFILKWIEENEYEMSDLIREVYIDGIWNKDNVEDWLTEIQVPIKK